MASTSAAEPSSVMKDSPNWLELPHELMANILQRLGTIGKLMSARKVCTTWRRICEDPAMWKVIDMSKPLDDLDADCNLGTMARLLILAKQAVDLSSGELIDVSIEWFGNDDLLNHIVLRSRKLKHLCLSNCTIITSDGLSHAVKTVPQLEKLHLSYMDIDVEDIKVIGRNCPQLKSFKLKELGWSFIPCDDDALAIANSMPELRHLQVSGTEMTKKGLLAILNGCPNLESLHVCMHSNLNLEGNIGILCMERIKDFFV